MDKGILLVIYHRFDSELKSDVYNQLLGKIPRDQRRTINRYQKWQDRQATLFSRLILLQGFKHFGFNFNPLIHLKSSKYGRPYIPDSIEFNISHSKDYVVCVFSKKRVGIDIEFINNSIDFSDFEDFFNDQEWKIINNDPNHINKFFQMWCKKESVFKVDGRGFSAPLNKLILFENHALLEKKKYFLKEIELDKSYQTFVAHEMPITDIEIIKYHNK